jgi:hypothetical protein
MIEKCSEDKRSRVKSKGSKLKQIPLVGRSGELPPSFKPPKIWVGVFNPKSIL